MLFPSLVYFLSFLFAPSLLLLPVHCVFSFTSSFLLFIPSLRFPAALSFSVSPSFLPASAHSQYDSISFIGSECVCEAEVGITVGIKTGNTCAFNGERLINASSILILKINLFLSVSLHLSLGFCSHMWILDFPVLLLW